MINNVTTFISSQDPRAVIAAAVLVGVLARPIVVKIMKLAFDIFSSFVNWVGNRTLVLRLRSLVCSDCAGNHKNHMKSIMNKHAIPSTPEPGSIEFEER